MLVVIDPEDGRGAWHWMQVAEMAFLQIYSSSSVHIDLCITVVVACIDPGIGQP